MPPPPRDPAGRRLIPEPGDPRTGARGATRVAALGISAGCIAAVLAVLAIDAEVWSRDLPRPLFGVLDESAHLLTGAVLLAGLWALGLWPGRGAAVALLAASVLIDVDHLPAEFGSEVLIEGAYRPYGHSLATVVTLLAAVVLVPPAWRAATVAVAAGVSLHLVRDMATGGVPLLWPSLDTVTIGRGWYHLGLAAVAVAAVAVSTLGPRRPAARPRRRRPARSRPRAAGSGP